MRFVPTIDKAFDQGDGRWGLTRPADVYVADTYDRYIRLIAGFAQPLGGGGCIDNTDRRQDAS